MGSEVAHLSEVGACLVEGRGYAPKRNVAVGHSLCLVGAVGRVAGQQDSELAVAADNAGLLGRCSQGGATVDRGSGHG